MNEDTLDQIMSNIRFSKKNTNHGSDLIYFVKNIMTNYLLRYGYMNLQCAEYAKLNLSFDYATQMFIDRSLWKRIGAERKLGILKVFYNIAPMLVSHSCMKWPTMIADRQKILSVMRDEQLYLYTIPVDTSQQDCYIW